MNDAATLANLEDMRQARLRQQLDGRSPIGLMHGANMNVDIPLDMLAVWNGYWDKPFDPVAVPVPERQGNGGYMFRVGPNQATYSRDGVKAFDVCRDTPLQVFANIDPMVGEYWERIFPGFKTITL